MKSRTVKRLLEIAKSRALNLIHQRKKEKKGKRSTRQERRRGTAERLGTGEKRESAG
jgi:hypothetical protein